MNFTISEMTKDCRRQDCSLSDYGVSTSTCMGWIPTYDKHGNRTDRGDPNIYRSGMRCSTCGLIWEIRTQYGETTMTLTNGNGKDAT